MINLACCIPGGSLMPEGVAEVPKSPAENIIEKCRYVLSLGYDFTECGGGMLAGLNEEELKLLADENKRESLRIAAVTAYFRETGNFQTHAWTRRSILNMQKSCFP